MNRLIAERLANVASEDVPPGVDLWPRMERHLRESRRTKPVRRTLSRRPMLIMASILVLLVLASAPASALAEKQGWIGGARWLGQRFGFVLVDQSPAAPTATVASRVVGPASTTANSPEPIRQATTSALLSLAEAETQAGYPIHLPTWLPDGLEVRGAFVGGGQVAVSYRDPHLPNGGLSLQQYPSAAAQGGYLIPESEVEQVQINGVPASYVSGSWNSQGQWDDRAQAARVSWVREGRVYIVQYSGLALTREELLRIAESIP